MVDQVLGMLLGILAIGLYLAPTLYSAIAKRQRNFGFATVFLINALLGWTVVGWVIAIFLAESLPDGRRDGWA